MPALPLKKLEGIVDPLIRQRYLKYFQLPQDLRQIIFAVETADKIREVAKKNNLNKDQLWWFSYNVGMVLLGETHIKDFVNSIQEKCKVEEGLARQLARGVNQAIFLLAKESLKKIHQLPEWPRESSPPEKPTPASPTPARPTLPSTAPGEPRIEGNIVDLKREK